MEDSFTLLICYHSGYDAEGIEPYIIELRHEQGIEGKEGVIHYTRTDKEAIKFAEQYMKEHQNVLSYEFGNLGK